VPLFCGFQLSPPSSVCKMKPLLPTIQPDCGVAKAMEKSHSPVLHCSCYRLLNGQQNSLAIFATSRFIAPKAYIFSSLEVTFAMSECSD
jgi:hypothetical protein